ncbi:hypothetical protein EXIGLDRAFT_351594 [Exidia glandulosa HHB12029]|uniref:Uncharacterized protein n=1 Tax=Exidia glandulosa HHB12029 TaxID=1314781 RepID=A0A165CCI0_EXIGL|nr:hypothetical protein EXIGLDRAFT_351594 [Exidia glandulosa HHB12029]
MRKNTWVDNSGDTGGFAGNRRKLSTARATSLSSVQCPVQEQGKRHSQRRSTEPRSRVRMPHVSQAVRLSCHPGRGIGC